MDHLIDRSLPRNYHAINWNALTGQYAYMVADFDLFCGDDFFLAFSQNSYGLRCQMHQLFDAGTRPRDGQLLKQCGELHDERHLARRETLADVDRRDQCKRHKHIRLYVERGHKTDDRFQNDGQSAENDREPRHIKRKRLKFQKTAYDRRALNYKKNNVLFDPAERQQPLQFFHNPFH